MHEEIQSVLGASARLLQGRVDVLQLCSRAEGRVAWPRPINSKTSNSRSVKRSSRRGMLFKQSDVIVPER